jgi:polar amino acid transport system substrate-binding protein
VSNKCWLAFLLAVVMFNTACGADTKTIRFVTDNEKEGGYLLAITQAAYAKVGYRVEVNYRPWARALLDVENGQEEALLGAQYSEERAAKMLYSNQVGQSDMVFFKLKETKISYHQLSDLRGYTVGTIIASTYTSEFDAMTEIKKESASDDMTNIRKLLAGRMPLFLEKKSVVLNALKTQFTQKDAEKIEYLTPPLKTMRFFNCFSMARQGYEQKAADFNLGLSLIIKDGTYKAILDRGLHE